MTDSPAYLVGVLAVSIILLIFLINWRTKLHPFLALTVVSFVAAVGAGLPMADIPETLIDGAGGTLGETGLVVFLGAMLGRLLADSGAVGRIADLVVDHSSPRTAPWVMTAVAFLIGIPMFFEVGLVVLMPVIYGVALRLDVAAGRPKTWYLKILIPAIAALSCLHGMLPPHPGPTIAVNGLDANIGLTIGLGLLCAVPAVILSGPVYAHLIAPRISLEPEDKLVRQYTGTTVEQMQIAARTATPDATSGAVDTAEPDAAPRTGTESGHVLRPVPTWLAFVCVLVPVVLMLFETVVDLVAPESALKTPAAFLGEPVIAMFVGVLFAAVVLSASAKMSGADVKASFGSSLGSVAGVALIIAGGGMFNSVLKTSDINDAIVDVVSGFDMNLILLGWLIGLTLSFCTGSATVGIVSATGILAPLVAGMPPAYVSLVVIAIGSGSVGLNWVNHAGFWFVKESFGMTLGQATKTHMTVQTLVSVFGLLMALLVSVFV
ncbi:GntP family permease [Corynebacterium kalidii]|uniref:GntP family permease n=1 Tax=Corynebacterium kalidii TaxID=2931982 RepID=A0A9X2AYT1_9CORY|nr:GntP family permease [Corynebacterium kalidii]MCJ7858386.1 GntP family permease [Corynebacterium kalidii]